MTYCRPYSIGITVIIDSIGLSSRYQPRGYLARGLSASPVYIALLLSPYVLNKVGREETAEDLLIACRNSLGSRYSLNNASVRRHRFLPRLATNVAINLQLENHQNRTRNRLAPVISAPRALFVYGLICVW